MFPEYRVHSITNGVHAATWLSQPFQRASSTKKSPSGGTTTSTSARSTASSRDAIAATHALGKQRLFATVKERTGVELDPNILTLGFARRVATYKRATLLFRDGQRLRRSRRTASAACRSLRRQSAPRRQRRQGPHPRRLRRRREVQQLEAAHPLPRELRLGTRRAADAGCRCLAEHAAPSVRSLRHQRHEGRAQRRALALASSTAGGSKAAPKTSPAGPSTTSTTKRTKPSSLYTKLENSIAPLYANKAAWAQMQRSTASR